MQDTTSPNPSDLVNPVIPTANAYDGREARFARKLRVISRMVETGLQTSWW